ncbi:unnamed protein product [Gongylonema pulchrum]|uniref:Uncharacterized protein n=1 Tax=Gongylonema pulchrum TaxID=637853 RepID=A0A183D665_9BILA|nr:unnamed protein product [Gongylonema pulchrum]
MAKDGDATCIAAELPWGSLKVVAMTGIDFSAPPGHFALKSVLQELFTVFDRRIHNLKDIDVRNFTNNHNSIGNDEQNEAKKRERT